MSCGKKGSMEKIHRLHTSGQHFSWFFEEVSNEMWENENSIWWKKDKINTSREETLPIKNVQRSRKIQNFTIILMSVKTYSCSPVLINLNVTRTSTNMMDIRLNNKIHIRLK